ncbi:methyltransferase FkbM-like protein [Pontibacter ummariensis]|uniref:Methyltransferase FkbM domain-containing protein n=1 Tax=Pontibacter ummariensis TaxID=1610492 RepID=A0A239BNA7_9BACT|nr:FkbM family methyltransferase [Pontibacter ummariensis]PRY15776.1 methyltransferase FkbM-like protein [Pontibacter ummariensis]SNS08583.1 Methyltransferase FkbM domain-containing protein [Pontibacter ummariensis]
MGFKELLKKLIIRNLPKSVISDIRKPLLEELEKAKEEAIEKDAYVNLSYSQEGEDLILNRLMEHRVNGFYIDIGAHHPLRFSNTYKFYLRGWRGVNIDALPGSMEMFNERRPRDINIETPILDTETDSLTYYMFNESALNTLDKKNADRVIKECPHYDIVNTISLMPRRLESILTELHLENKKIDFMNVDVEGVDLEVLQSNNWELYRPQYVLIESIATSLLDDFNSGIYKFLAGKGYKLISKTVNTLIFESENEEAAE